MDGTSFNALYFPATMLHYVRTVATSASRRRWLYLGLATEVIPQDPKIREAIRSRLYQPAPMETSAAPVVHLRHLQQQSTTAFTWDLLQRLATRTQDKVTDYPSWHELQRLQVAQRDYALACDRVAAGDWNQVEQQLLSLCCLAFREALLMSDGLESWLGPVRKLSVHTCWGLVVNGRRELK